MEYLQSILLGIVQGIAEFLPISSSGHLVLAEELLNDFATGSALQLGEAESNLALNIALHLGTLFSIVVVYWRQLCLTLRQPRLIAAVVAATIPTGVLGILLKDPLAAVFGSPLAVGFALCGTAGLLWSAGRFDQGETELSQISLSQGFLIGLFQSVALVPGISRSGSTIVGGLWLGLQRDAAATFSFLIAVPVIAGAAVLMAAEQLTAGDISIAAWRAYAVGAFAAFVVGVLALKWLLALIARRKLHQFAWYCGAVGLLAIVLSLVNS